MSVESKTSLVGILEDETRSLGVIDIPIFEQEIARYKVHSVISFNIAFSGNPQKFHVDLSNFPGSRYAWIKERRGKLKLLIASGEHKQAASFEEHIEKEEKEEIEMTQEERKTKERRHIALSSDSTTVELELICRNKAVLNTQRRAFNIKPKLSSF